MQVLFLRSVYILSTNYGSGFQVVLTIRSCYIPKQNWSLSCTRAVFYVKQELKFLDIIFMNLRSQGFNTVCQLLI